MTLRRWLYEWLYYVIVLGIPIAMLVGIVWTFPRRKRTP